MSASPTILIVDDFHPLLMQTLSEAHLAVEYLPHITREEMLHKLQTGDYGLVVRSKIDVDADFLRGAPGLRFVARGGAGMDNVDEETAAALGIPCFNAGEANSDAVGEHALGMLISLFRHIHTADAEVRKNQWDREGNRGLELAGRSIGIIGFGNTGSAFARKLSGLGMQVMAYDKFKKGFGNNQVNEVSLEELVEKAEIVSLHVPLNSHTKFMVSSDFIHRFVRNIYLLNLSRGKIVRTLDVVKALQKGKLAGFAADVLEHEDPAQMGPQEREWFDELARMRNVILTPHIAGWTTESYMKIATVLAAKIIDQTQSAPQ